MAVPGLFACGVVFGYFVVLPAAVHFLQNFNSGSFEQFVQASSYYSFAALIMLAMGLIFQVPLAVVAASRAGIVTKRQLRKNRRFAIVAAALIAALLPGDVVTMTLETLPVIVLYEVGILVVSWLDRRDARRARSQNRSAAPTATPPPPPPPIPPPISSDNAF
jgi:sec-independent protein translocase protein TatC